MERAVKRFLIFILLATSCFGQDPMQFAPFMMQSGIVTDWSTRVVANGGALPSQNTIQAMETLRTTLISQGITNKIYALCNFVPDSVIACCTPLFYHLGYTNWGNSNFVSGDLTINGLKGNGSTKMLETGIRMQDFVPVDGSSGMSLIVTESASNAVNTTAGYMTAAGTVAFSINVSDAGITRWRDGTFGLDVNTINTNDWGRVGFVSGSRYDNDDLILYVASPLESHKLLSVRSNTFQSDFSTDANTISIFAQKRGTTNESGTFSAQRVSMVMIHDAFTQTESSNVWWAFKTCREQLNGGTGDPVHDWNRKIVDAGGAAISSTTSNAARTYESGLDTQSLLYKMLVANLYAPDNLTAVRVPLIWQAGSEVWTNFNFGSTNLTVNGLTGNGTTKYLGTGIHPSVVANRGFGAASAGISLLIYNTPSSAANMLEVGGQASAPAANIFSLGMQVGLLTYYCWSSTTVNTDFARRTVPVTNYAGFLSGNRTAANAIRLDWVTNSVHNIATNGTGNQSASPIATNLFAGAFNANGTAANFSDRTISYAAWHSGLTQTESSNHWELVKAFRNSAGGGVP